MKNNFYVDNLLKSIENEDMVVHLIEKVIGMSHEGDFNLTKFASNIKRVVQSIPDKIIRFSVKDKDLVRDLSDS